MKSQTKYHDAQYWQEQAFVKVVVPTEEETRAFRFLYSQQQATSPLFGPSFEPKALAFLRETTKFSQSEKNLSSYNRNVLKLWYFSHLDHPYPTPEQKQTLCLETGLSPIQVQTWFVNIRKRYWLKQRNPVNSSSVTVEPAVATVKVEPSKKRFKPLVPALEEEVHPVQEEVPPVQEEVPLLQEADLALEGNNWSFLENDNWLTLEPLHVVVQQEELHELDESFFNLQW
jgi:hypothetical protein